MIDFDVVIILKVLLFVSLSFLAVAVEFGTRRFFGFGFRLFSFDFVQGSEIIFQIIHIIKSRCVRRRRGCCACR